MSSNSEEINHTIINSVLPKALKEVWGEYKSTQGDRPALESFASFLDEVENSISFGALRVNLGIGETE